MLRRAVVPLALACAGTFAAVAPGRAAEPAPLPGATDARAWLLRVHEAAGRKSYAGTFVVTGGGSVASARIAHYADGPNRYERIESLDGKRRSVYRHNDVVQTVWPGSQVAMVEQRGLLGSFPALLQAGSDGIGEWYELKVDGVERVAGHEAHVLAVRPRDAYRHGYRLWADRASGLLLRLDVVGERGDVLETSAFSDVAIGVRPQPAEVLNAMRIQPGWRVVRPQLVPTRLELQGWSMRTLAPGFRQVSCVSRRMDGGNGAAAEAPAVLQAIYSDGLTYVSVFIEPYRADRHARPALSALGATLSLAERQGDWWITVVGDTPLATLKQFAGGLERRKP
jgi:sigma-E factor negative regulatory protein RseB